MTDYSVNPVGVARCRELIEARQYVLDSDWGESQPDAEARNAYLRSDHAEDSLRDRALPNDSASSAMAPRRIVTTSRR
jgi:hypothetical protein